MIIVYILHNSRAIDIFGCLSVFVRVPYFFICYVCFFFFWFCVCLFSPSFLQILFVFIFGCSFIFIFCLFLVLFACFILFVIVLLDWALKKKKVTCFCLFVVLVCGVGVLI